MSVKQQIVTIQQALAAKGFSPGNIDGVWGRRTESAVRSFQASRGLGVDGIVGPATRQALFGAAIDSTGLEDVGLVWFQEARRLLGVTEGKDGINNRVILDWAGDAGIPYKSDDIPWCGLFVAHCISATLSVEALPSNPLAAQAWLKFGGPCSPSAGAVIVFWREKSTSWKGHVGFYAGEDEAAFHILGGNQSDKVSIARVARNRLLGARWPATVPLSDAGPTKMAMGTSLSAYED